MKVRTSLFLLSAIFVILIAALGYVMFHTSELVNREVRESESATKIIKDVFELSIVTNDYLSHHEERMVQQWQLKYDSLGKYLEGMRKEDIHPEHLSILESITSDYESLGETFSLLQANCMERTRLIEENKPQAEIDLSLDSEYRLSAQALMGSQRMASAAFNYSAMMQQRISQVQQRTNSIALVSIIGFVVISFTTSFFTATAIIRPLNDLTKSAEIIGKGNLKHRVDIKTRNELGELALAFNQMTERRQEAEEKLEHLNLVLRAIRHVNQLVVRERNRDRLLQSACGNLIENRGYHSVWIALLDESEKLVTHTEAGLGDDFMPIVDLMKRGELTYCGRKALDRPGVIAIKDPVSECLDCPLSGMSAGRGDMIIRLEAREKVYGLMVVSLPSNMATDEEEQDLFKEVAGDIAFALHNMELEEERMRAEEALKEYSERLEEMVEERTQELHDAQEALIRKEKLAMLGQLSGSMAHELRNPLGVISNAVYYLKTVLPDAGEQVKEYLELVEEETIISEKIVSDLLDYGRTRPPEREDVNAAEMVRQTLERLPTPDEIEVNIKIPEDIPEVYADPHQIGQVLINLVKNAYQAMPDGGKLTISAHAIEISEGSGKPPRFERVALSIADTGCGISKENIAKLFTPLFTTKARGIGLGLATSKNLVEANGGTIEVESDGLPGKGSTFTIGLPVKSEAGEYAR